MSLKPALIDGADIRERLRVDHQRFLEELDEVCTVTDERRSQARLQELRRGWRVHALTEEMVVYRALEGVDATASSGNRADDRFAEHELVEAMFDKLACLTPRMHEWQARLDVLLSLLQRHVDTDHFEMFPRLAERFDAAQLAELGEQFALARDKLTLLEELKAA